MLTRIKKIVLSKTVLILLSLFVSVGVVGSAFFYKVNKANGYITCKSGSPRCFYGKVSALKLCCNGIKVTVDGNDGGGDFMLTASTKLYSWYNVSQGQCVMGNASMFAVCIIITTWPPCTDSENTDGEMNMIGTTLTGPPSGMCSSGFGI